MHPGPTSLGPAVLNCPLRPPQVMHRLEILISRRAEGKTGRAFIGAMTEEMSVQMASKLASEGFIFMASGGRTQLAARLACPSP